MGSVQKLLKSEPWQGQREWTIYCSTCIKVSCMWVKGIVAANKKFMLRIHSMIVVQNYFHSFNSMVVVQINFTGMLNTNNFIAYTRIACLK